MCGGFIEGEVLDVGVLKDEVERLRKRMQELQDSANKDLKLMQMHKEREKDRSDVDMTLDAGRQELELIRCKLQVQGTAGSTTACPATNQAKI
ncbi:uncharacterized protein ARMOST_18556 [Armillaria ostoyae]|uniref:Uncharacterized protein n=1 Tax=Armillaria ostoyae TaxID=47428 RepID=A0A284S268_ARMOS|nr:uncharacterized protein ARMOST_18556 [Armillaria ostoyae]